MSVFVTTPPSSESECSPIGMLTLSSTNSKVTCRNVLECRGVLPFREYRLVDIEDCSFAYIFAIVPDLPHITSCLLVPMSKDDAPFALSVKVQWSTVYLVRRSVGVGIVATEVFTLRSSHRCRVSRVTGLHEALYVHRLMCQG